MGESWERGAGWAGSDKYRTIISETVGNTLCVLIGNAFWRLQSVHHECRDLGFLGGAWAPPCPHGEGKKQETMSFKG